MLRKSGLIFAVIVYIDFDGHWRWYCFTFITFSICY